MIKYASCDSGIGFHQAEIVWVLWTLSSFKPGFTAKIEWDLLNCSECFHTLPVQRRDLSPQEPERHTEEQSLNWRWQLCQIWWEADGLDGIRTDERRHKHIRTLQDRASPQLGHCPGQTNKKFVKYFFCFDGDTICETACTRWILS